MNATGTTAVADIPTQGNAAATNGLDTVFDAHYARIARVIGRVIFDQARAEELAVEVFLKWKAGHTDGWLYRTAVREALDELRRQGRRNRLHAVLARFRAAPETPEQLYAANSEQARVRAVLAALRPRHAELLVLWSEDLSYRDMAVALSLELSYVGSLLSRAQDAFRKEYLKRYGKSE